MRRRLSEALIGGPHAQELLAWTTYIAFGLALVPTFGALASSIKDHNWIGTAIYGLFLGALGFLAYIQLRRHRPLKQINTVVFQPFLKLPELDVWPRPSDLDSINSALRHHSHLLPLVVGASGSGKTVLLHRLLEDQLRVKKIPHEYIDEYADFREHLTIILNDYKAARPNNHEPNLAESYATEPVVILDQFEQYLAYLRQLTPDGRERERAWFKNVITTCRSEDRCRFLISIRNEWYYDLEWLGDMIPAPVNCISIAGPRANAEDDITRTTIAARLKKVLGDDTVKDSVLTALGRGSSGRLLLLETQIVGAVLERDISLGRTIGPSYIATTLGGIEGAIDKYFEGILEGAMDRRVALKVLCALSVRTDFRRQEKIADLLDGLFEDSEDVREALKYLAKQRIVIERPTARYELVHDYIARYFHQKSGSELDPTDRDNVLYHFEGDTAEINKFIALTTEADKSRRGLFAFAVIGPLIFIMTLRLIFGLPWSEPPNLLSEEFLWDGRFFDVVYLPIYVAHLAWAIYVALLYQRLLSRFSETPLNRLFSQITVLNMAACVVAAMFVPYIWLASIGWGGIVVGLKLLSVSRVKQINSAARTRFRLFGGVTIFNLVFLATLGVILALVSSRYVTNHKSINSWIYVSCLFSLIVTYACSVLAAVHVQRRGVSQLLGLLARMGTSPAPSLAVQ